MYIPLCQFSKRYLNYFCQNDYNKNDQKSPPKKKNRDFLEIEKFFENKKGANYELMVKSQFLLNYVGYFKKKMTKIRERFFADFPQYLTKYWTEIRENQETELI